MSELIDAVVNNDIEEVETLLNNGADINIQDNDGDTALMLASKYGRTDIVRLLLDHGANSFIRNFLSKTALMIASEYGRTDIVRLLLDQVVDIDIQDGYGNTTLNIAVKVIVGWDRWSNRDQDQLIEIVRLLLERGADPNIPDNKGHTALTIAKRMAATDLIMPLVERHMDARKTQKAIQRLALSKLLGLTKDYDIFIEASKSLGEEPYNPGVTKRMELEREEEKQNERMADYLDTLAQYDGGRRRRRRKKTMRKRYY